jgi:competence ComEA-like helix-hairpin-helix protein
LVLLLAVALFAASVAHAQKKAPPASPIDLNAATAAQLRQIPGIGPSTAQSIVKMRDKSGHFQRVEDLLAIHGISPARLDKIRPYIYVGSPPAPK